jgi:hypothetical protein
MLPSLGPAVAAAPFWARATAYTLLWTAYTLGLQFAIEGFGTLLRARGGLAKASRCALCEGGVSLHGELRPTLGLALVCLYCKPSALKPACTD